MREIRGAPIGCGTDKTNSASYPTASASAAANCPLLRVEQSGFYQRLCVLTSGSYLGKSVFLPSYLNLKGKKCISLKVSVAAKLVKQMLRFEASNLQVGS